jgi:nitroreductase
MIDQTTSLDTLAMLARRRSLPPTALVAPGPTPTQLGELLHLAARVPDHGKLAPWRFIVFEGEARDRAGAILADVLLAEAPDTPDKRLEIERQRFRQAPLVVAVVSRAAPHVKIPEWEQVLSAGAVCMTLTVAATAMGFATAWLSEWIAYDAGARAALGLATHERIAGFVHIGTPILVPEDRVRPVMDEIVSYF